METIPDVPPVLTLAEFQKRIDTTFRMAILDASSPAEFVRHHIPGSVNLPPDQVATRSREVLGDTSLDVVVYGVDSTSVEPDLVARELGRAGYVNVTLFRGGLREWADAGLVLDSLSTAGGMTGAPK